MKSSIKSALICLLLAITVTATGFAQRAPQSNQPRTNQQEEPDDAGTISIDSTLVTVPVVVSDRQGRYVSGLKAQDFQLYEDNVKQEIAFFEEAETPLNVALLIDTSKSTRFVIDDIKDAAIGFLNELRPQDKAIVIAFDYEVNVLSPLTADRRVLARAIESAQIGDYAGTMLNDAVNTAVREHLRSLQGRKAILLLTDGKDHGSRITAQDLLASIDESNALIYSIFYTTGQMNNRQMDRGQYPDWNRRRNQDRNQDPYDQYPQQRRRRNLGRFEDWRNQRQEQRQERRRDRVEEKNQEAEEFLNQLSDVTAGRFYRSEITDLDRTFRAIADELRHQYQLGFYPESNQEISHSLKVQVKRNDLVVRSRRTYSLDENQKPQLRSRNMD